MKKKKADDTKGTTSRDANAAQRAALALQLRAQRLTYDEIARRCGYGSRQAAHKAIQRELSRVVIDNAEEFRKEELVLLDQLQAKVWKRLEDPKFDTAMLFAVDRLLQISERRSKLLGLDATPATVAAAAVVVREVPAGYLGGEMKQ